MMFKKIIVLSVVTIMSVGCTKFTTTKKVDLTPFAEQTVAMLGEADYGLRQDETIRLREYLNLEQANLKRSFEVGEEADELLRGIVSYSIDIVTLSEADKTEPEKVEALAEYLATFEDAFPEESQEIREQFQELLSDVRRQEKYLDALKAAQPLVNAAVSHGVALLDESDRLVTAIAEELEMKINAEYAVTQEFQERLEEQKGLVLQGLEQLLDHNAVRLQEVLEGQPPSPLMNPESEAFLLEQLQQLQTISGNLSPDFIAWEEDHRELDRIYADILDENRRAKLVLIVWGRAHQKMASGVDNPAEWFELKDLVEIGARKADQLLLF
jgi:hypothetical protein